MHPVTTASSPGIATKPENVKLRLRWNDGSSLGRFVEGDCIITSVSMSMAVGEVLSAEVAFEFNGAPEAVVL